MKMFVFIVLGCALNILLIQGELCSVPELEFCDEVANNLLSPTANQLIEFTENNPEPIGDLTTLAGKQIEVGAGAEFLNGIDGSILRSDLLEMIQHFNRELIPARVVGAKGTGAFGNFNVTEDVSDIFASVDAFNGIGKVTQVVVRFSPLSAGPGGQDTLRTLRAMAVKFYAVEGNFDILTISLPNFPVKDPLKMSTLARVQLRNPQTHRLDMTSLLDFLVINEETSNHFIRLYSYLGIPCSYQNMAGYTAQTLAACDKAGNNRFVRLRFQPGAGVKGLSNEDALRLAGENPDYFQTSLYNQIASGDFPTWTLSVQSLTKTDVDNADFNVFDSTFELPEDKYPYRVIGKLTLTDNPENYFRDVEQTAFSTGNLPRGLKGVPGDKLFEATPFVYRDAQNHRLGVNHDRIVANRPKSLVFSFERDGAAPVGPNGGNSPNYFPNSFNGPVPVATPKCPELNFTVFIEPGATNFGQASDFYQRLPSAEQDRLAENMVRTLLLVTAEDVVKKARILIRKLDKDLSAKVEAMLKEMQKTCPVPRRKKSLTSSSSALVEYFNKIFKIRP